MFESGQWENAMEMYDDVKQYYNPIKKDGPTEFLNAVMEENNYQRPAEWKDGIRFFGEV